MKSEGSVELHARVLVKRPWLTASGILWAWETALISVDRPDSDPPQIAAIGFDNDGKLLELLAFQRRGGAMVIYHAMPVTRRFLKELGLDRRHINNFMKGR